MDNNHVDELIRDTYTEFNEEIDIYSNLEIPDFDNAISKFHNNINENNSIQVLGKRLAMVASFVIAVLATTIVSPISQVDAYKANMVQTVERLRGDAINIMLSTTDGNPKYELLNNLKDDGKSENELSVANNNFDQVEKVISIEEIKKEVPFEILSPQYLPDGYKLENSKLIQTKGNVFEVIQSYTGRGEVGIRIIQTTILPGTEETICFNASFRRKYLHINDLNITLFTDDKNFKNTMWIKNNMKFEMLVPYSVTDKQIEKIIKSLK